MRKKHLLAIVVTLLMTALLLVAYNIGTITRPMGLPIAFRGGGAIGSYDPEYRTFENVVRSSTDVVVAELVAQRPFGELRTQFEFIVHERIFGNAPDTIFVYAESIQWDREFTCSDLPFTTNTQYLLALRLIANVYANYHVDGYRFTADLMLDLNNPSESTLFGEPLSPSSNMNFNRGRLTREQVISYVRTLEYDSSPPRVFITSDSLEDIINGSPNVVIVEIVEMCIYSYILREGPSRQLQAYIHWADRFDTTIVEVLKGDLQVGDMLSVVFFGDTVNPGETHLVSTVSSDPNNPNSHMQRFTSSHSLHSLDQRDEIIAIIHPGAPTITGPYTYELQEGYSATHISGFTVTGDPPPTVTLSYNHGESITWHDEHNRLNIAAGIPAGVYTIVLTADNGVGEPATHTFVLTVSQAAPPGPTTIVVPLPRRNLNYTHTLNVSSLISISAPMTWALTGNPFPPGFTFNTNTGTITGRSLMPTDPTTITIEVRNGFNDFIVIEFNFQVTA